MFKPQRKNQIVCFHNNCFFLIKSRNSFVIIHGFGNAKSKKMLLMVFLAR